MASPLTVCLVVLGKHVPGLRFVGLLMDDTAALAPEYGFYQRLVARDQSEAAELIGSHIKNEPPASVYDALLLPALGYAERDRLEHRLSLEEDAAVIEATRELIADAAETIRRHAETEPPAAAATPSVLGPREPLQVLGYAVNGAADEVALAMLAQLVDDLPIAIEITAARMQAIELVSFVRDRTFSVVCFADLPPSPSSKTRYLVRRLRSALPEVRIAVGRWGPPPLADENPQALVMRQTLWIRFVGMAILAGSALVSAACASMTINQVLADPSRYRNREVQLSGAVVDSSSVANRGAYRIDDETGQLWVVSDKGTRAGGRGFEPRRPRQLFRS